mgnify:CR=1 FL=1
MKPRFYLILTALLLATAAHSQTEALNSIKESDAVTYMNYLASDALEGRRTGSRGNNAAADYISTTALNIGVKPLPGRQDLFQTLEYLKITTYADSSVITISDTLGNSCFSTLLRPLMAPSNDVDLSGEVVFGGYGYLNTGARYNDFEGISLSDRIVMIMTRNPDLEGTGLPLTGEPVNESIESRKLPMLLMQRAKAILYVADPALEKEITTDDMAFGQSYQVMPLFRKPFGFNINAYVISRETADKLLQSSGKTLALLQKTIALTKKPASFVLPDVKAEVTIKVNKDTVTSSNVIGYIEGSDSILKNECVIYTAHYDHLGMDALGNVFNGANDNASGSIGLLNVARAFSELEVKPLRSIVFLWTTGEEEGLHGSSYYVDNPLFPLDKTVADINFDMIGRSRMKSDVGASLTGAMDITGPDTIKIVSARDFPSFLNDAKESCHETGLYPIDEGKGDHFSGSDHFPFYRKGIPALFFFTGLHHDYHQKTDDIEFIDFEKLIKVSKAGFLTGYRVANERERPVKDKSGRQ